MPAIYLPKGRDMILFARRLAAANRARLSQNGYLRIAAPERLLIPRRLFQECFPSLEGVVGAARWNALLTRHSGHVARFSPEVIELVDRESADIPVSLTLTTQESNNLAAWAQRLNVPQEELIRAAARSYLDLLQRDNEPVSGETQAG